MLDFNSWNSIDCREFSDFASHSTFTRKAPQITTTAGISVAPFQENATAEKRFVIYVEIDE